MKKQHSVAQGAKKFRTSALRFIIPPRGIMPEPPKPTVGTKLPDIVGELNLFDYDFVNRSSSMLCERLEGI